MGTEVAVCYTTNQIETARTYLVGESRGLCQKSAVRVGIIGQPLSREDMDMCLA